MKSDENGTDNELTNITLVSAVLAVNIINLKHFLNKVYMDKLYSTMCNLNYIIYAAYAVCFNMSNITHIVYKICDWKTYLLSYISNVFLL